MVDNINRDIIVEILVRIVLCVTYLIVDEFHPFIREIRPEEKWLYSYPVKPSYISAEVLWITVLSFPTLFLIAELFVTNEMEDAAKAFFGISLAYGLTGILTSYLKVIVGRPRPSFVGMCFPGGSGSDLNKCTGSIKDSLDGRKSFPSGHSSFFFVCMVFMALYMARKLNWSLNDSFKGLKISICFIPILIAISVSVSRTCDYHHHYQDVIVGGLLGSIIAWYSYSLYFPNNEAIKG